MKTKLTLSVDEEVIPRAKRYARERGTSLSEMVEAVLRSIAATPARPTFSERWRGKFTIKSRDEARYKALAKRYGL